MSVYPKMIDLKNQLTILGHSVIIPSPSSDEQLQEIINNKYIDTYDLKMKYDYIKKHYANIVEADCVLIANYDKNEVKNYVGGNSFLEMGYAYSMNKPIYLVNSIPLIEHYYHEMIAMEPIIINGDLKKIPNNNKI